ncbi:hypothetical protein JZM27_02745 [Providencia huaxiensis]|nr:hypothetical protein [Providencia huaxiensis]
MYSDSSYGSRPGLRNAQLRLIISCSSASTCHCGVTKPASRWRLRCAALRSAGDLATE